MCTVGTDQIVEFHVTYSDMILKTMSDLGDHRDEIIMKVNSKINVRVSHLLLNQMLFWSIIANYGSSLFIPTNNDFIPFLDILYKARTPPKKLYI